MKHFIIIILWVICFYCETYAQNSLNSLLSDIQEKKITIIGCLINEEFDGEQPWVKKLAFETDDMIVFLMSDPYAENQKIVCKDVIIFEKSTEEIKSYVLEQQQEVLDSIIKEQKIKEFPYICGILDWNKNPTVIYDSRTFL